MSWGVVWGWVPGSVPGYRCLNSGQPSGRPAPLASPAAPPFPLNRAVEAQTLHQTPNYRNLTKPNPPLPAPFPAAGFEDYDKVRKDPNLATLRKSPKFKRVIDRYDEPIINEGAIKALKSLFSFGKKSDDDEL